MTAPAALPSRDSWTALLICAGIGAALLFGWRSPSSLPAPTPAPAAVSAAAPAAAVPLVAGEPVNADFNLDTAMRLAGTQVPPELDSFYFFAMLEPASEAQDIAELGSKMQAAASERDYLGIAGPDAERNLRTLLAALDAHRGEDLSGMILIYVGPVSHRQTVSDAAGAARVELRFVAYPEAPPPI